MTESGTGTGAKFSSGRVLASDHAVDHDDCHVV